MTEFGSSVLIPSRWWDWWKSWYGWWGELFIGTVCAKGSSMLGCMGSHIWICGEPSSERGSEYMVLGREPYELTESWSLPMNGDGA